MVAGSLKAIVKFTTLLNYAVLFRLYQKHRYRHDRIGTLKDYCIIYSYWKQ